MASQSITADTYGEHTGMLFEDYEVKPILKAGFKSVDESVVAPEIRTMSLVRF